MLKNFFFLFLFLKALIANNYLSAEPFVVLQYNNDSEFSDRSNEFAQDPDYTNKHRILPGESLNNHAFRNKNINYMIADKTIHLPSINQISKLMKGIDFELDEQLNYKQNNIYYFGG